MNYHDYEPLVNADDPYMPPHITIETEDLQTCYIKWIIKSWTYYYVIVTCGIKVVPDHNKIGIRFILKIAFVNEMNHKKRQSLTRGNRLVAKWKSLIS